MTTLRADRGEPARVSAHSAIKLRVPPPPACNLPRQRLIDQLDAAGPEGVVVVHGPAGSGKTSLVADWASSLARPVSWLTLDERDRVGGEFWTDLFAAIDRVRPGSLDGLNTLLHDNVPSGVLADELVMALDRATGDPATLVLDDFHVIAGQPELIGMFRHLLRHQPVGLQLVVVSRSRAGAVARSGATRWSTGHGRLRRSAVLRDRGRRAAPSPDARRRRGVDQRHDRPRRWVGRGSPAVRSRVTVRGVGDPDHRGLPDG